MASAVKYTNGFRVDDVVPIILGRRKFRQPTRSDFPFYLSSDNVWGQGDNYSPVFESVHTVVSPYNIWVTQEDDSITEENFNALLLQKRTDVVMKVLTGVLDVTEDLERKLLFERFGRNDYLNANTGYFVGVRIKPSKRFDVTCVIEQVALKFNGDITFPMYLFHDAAPFESLATFTVTAKANEQTIIPINQMISYTGEQNKSGCYFFGYFQEDLGNVQAWNEVVTSINDCNNFGLNPIEMPRQSTGVNVNNLSFTIKTHGFNLQMYAFRDHTQKIINNAWLFDNLIGLQMAADVIEMMQNNTRTNKDQRISAEMSQKLYNDLNTAKATEVHPFSVGLKERIEKEAKRVKNELYKKVQVAAITHDTDTVNVYGVPPIIPDPFKY
jgi:hypothetical protein